MYNVNMKPQQHSQKSSKLLKALNVIFWILGPSLILIGLFILFVYLTTPLMPIGYGDIIFLAFLPIILAGLVSVAYIIMVAIHIMASLKKKVSISKLHTIAAAAIFIVGLLPYFGPINFTFNLMFQPAIQSISTAVKHSQFTGPTAEQLAEANLQSFDKAQTLIDGCNVSSILYWRFDYEGPYTKDNAYIIVKARNNGTIAYEPAPSSVNLAFSEKYRLEEAMKNYHKGPYPACLLDVEWDKRGFGDI